MINFPFVQFEFTQSLGPPPGRYAVKLLDSEGAPVPNARRASAEAAEEALAEVGDSFGSADIVVLQVRGAPTPTPSRFRNRLPARPEAEEPTEVSITLATIILSTNALADEGAAKRFGASVRESDEAQQQLITRALDLLRRCVGAYRVSAADPYVADISPLDARITRIGYGLGGAVVRGGWSEAFQVKPERGRRVTRTGRLMPVQAMAAILSGDGDMLEAEDMLLAASRDVDNGRLRAAAMTLVSAVDLLLAELEGHELANNVVSLMNGLSSSRDAAIELAQRALGDQLTSADEDRLRQVIETAGALVDAWRYVPLGFG